MHPSAQGDSAGDSSSAPRVASVHVPRALAAHPNATAVPSQVETTPGLMKLLGYYTAEARPLIAQAVQHAIDNGEGYDLELAMVTAGGRAIWVRTVGEVEWLDGRPVRLLGAFQDISARRELELALRRNAELVQSVIENDFTPDLYATKVHVGAACTRQSSPRTCGWLRKPGRCGARPGSVLLASSAGSRLALTAGGQSGSRANGNAP